MIFTQMVFSKFQEFFDDYVENMDHDEYLNLTVPANKIVIAEGPSASVNRENAPENAIFVYTGHYGGPIIGFKSGITLLCFTKEKIEPNFCKKLANLLVKEGLNAVVDGNDVLVDGYKVAGSMSRRLGNRYYTGIHVSMNVDNDVIFSVCNREIKKIPKGLSDYGLSRTKVINALKDGEDE